VGGFWEGAWASFKAAFGPVLAGAAFLLALLGPLYAPDSAIRISLIWVTVLGLVALTLLWTATNMIVVARATARPRLPRTRHVMVSEGRGAAVTVILVLERSELFGVNILVTIYYSERLEVGREMSSSGRPGSGVWSTCSRTA